MMKKTGQRRKERRRKEGVKRRRAAYEVSETAKYQVRTKCKEEETATTMPVMTVGSKAYNCGPE